MVVVTSVHWSALVLHRWNFTEANWSFAAIGYHLEEATFTVGELEMSNDDDRWRDWGFEHRSDEQVFGFEESDVAFSVLIPSWFMTHEWHFDAGRHPIDAYDFHQSF